MAGDSSLRVQVHPADDGGCLGGSYRMRWPAEALAAQGHDVTIAESLGAQYVDDLVTGASKMVGVEHPGVDVVVIQRPLKAELVELIPHLQALGVAVVVEIDDDFETLPPANISYKRVHPTNPGRNRALLREACRGADHVVVSTPALAQRYGGHGRVTVVPNFVPERYLTVRDDEERQAVTIGWTGSIYTHPGDLEVTRGAVARALDATGACMRVIGTGVGVAQRLGLAVLPETTGWVELEDYPAAMASIDVGIVPLDDTAFNQAKSWLKGLEFAAVGVPFVASPTQQYEALHRHGVGLLARRPREWERALRTLVGSETLRAEMAEHGREVASTLTIEGNAWRFMEAWTAATKVAA